MIHPSAIVDESAIVADDVEVGPFSIVGADVTLESGCVIGAHVVLKGPTKIGARTRIYPFASVGEDPQDLKYAGERTSLEIGEDNVIREYATINRGTVGGGGVTRIGNHNLLMAYIHVAHDCQIGSHVVFSNGASLAGHVTVGDYAILSGFALVHQFCTVGEHAFVGLSSVANRDITPYTLAVGNYATARGINKNGLRRRGFSDDTISALHRAYVALVRQRGDREEAIASLASDAAGVPEVQRLIDFITASERGIVR
ncbi:MAG: acyl-ACP--UDP-N-acetylglucosamine O-acyltransferase [Gammaproteobacteria bacterium]|nr:acyl-ACP--UDP-N-acetylglucosamine O-acyltransferase [Gammaproteobacteria bacterium]